MVVARTADALNFNSNCLMLRDLTEIKITCNFMHYKNKTGYDCPLHGGRRITMLTMATYYNLRQQARHRRCRELSGSSPVFQTVQWCRTIPVKVDVPPTESV